MDLSKIKYEIPEIDPTSSVECCDYYQRTVGYEFTTCLSNRNAFVLDGRAEGSLHDLYKNMSTPFRPMNWKFNELIALIKA